MKAIINGKEIDTYSIDDEIICPHCGHVHKYDPEMFAYEDIEFDDVEFECGECGEVFLVSRRVSWSFNTYKNED
ncbi:MAG: hypothetical protein IKO46_06135 [Salinivirgaceae bacterium]|nr:hypothetical protein [Salinivirgaceae bacterium]MBR4620543.1 hypothetical protein [Salinivirgaceae bacterium]